MVLDQLGMCFSYWSDQAIIFRRKICMDLKPMSWSRHEQHVSSKVIFWKWIWYTWSLVHFCHLPLLSIRIRNWSCCEQCLLVERWIKDCYRQPYCCQAEHWWLITLLVFQDSVFPELFPQVDRWQPTHRACIVCTASKRDLLNIIHISAGVVRGGMVANQLLFQMFLLSEIETCVIVKSRYK